MVNARDKRIIEGINTFNFMTSSQVGEMFCSTNSNKKQVANRILKRLKSDSWINSITLSSTRDYVYYSANNTIEKNEPNINYYLQVVEVFLEMNKYSPVTDYYKVINKLEGEEYDTSLCCHWLNKKYYVEVNNVYSINNIKDKLLYYNNQKGSGTVLLVDNANFNLDKSDYDIEIEYVNHIEGLSRIFDRYNDYKSMGDCLEGTEVETQIEALKDVRNGVDFRTKNSQSVPSTIQAKSNNGRITYILK